MIKFLGRSLVASALMAAGGAVLMTGQQAVPVVSVTPIPAVTVHPGVSLLMITASSGSSTTYAQCTGDFIFRDGADVYIGMAAHCAGTGTGPASGLNEDCTAPVQPLGTPVYLGDGPVTALTQDQQVGEVGQGPEIGTLAYDSWGTMQSVGGYSSDECNYNDFALVQLLPGIGYSATVPVWGGPVGLSSGAAAGSLAYLYGNSAQRQGLALLSPMAGLVTGTTGGGWVHEVAAGAIPGDSGGPVLDATGHALGIVTTLNIGTEIDGIDDTGLELAYAQSHALPGLALASGGPFTGP